MRILYLSSSPFLATRDAAGWGTHIREVVRAMERAPAGSGDRRHAVHLVTGEGPLTDTLTNPAPSLLRRVVPSSARCLRREWLEIRHDRMFFQRARSAAHEFGPDVIYERAAILHRSGARLARVLGLPLVLEQNSPQVDERIALGGMALARLARRWERSCYAEAAAVVTVSTALRDYVVGMGAPPKWTFAVPNGARPDLFDVDDADGDSVRRRFGLPPSTLDSGGAVVAGFVGAFADWHGLDRLMQAFALAQGDVQCPLYLLLVGDGPHRASLEVQARDLGILPRVLFAGTVPHERVPDYLAAMDITVMPSSNWYGSPVKLFEYGAMGRAVIAPDTPPVREVMTAGEEGLIISPGSVAELRTALVELAEDRLLRDRLGSRFRERVLREFTWDRVAQRLLAICSEVCGRAGHQSPGPRASVALHGVEGTASALTTGAPAVSIDTGAAERSTGRRGEG